jgi:hypothetical protein
MEDDKHRQLRETYRNLMDGELLSLAADAGSLTFNARQALMEEMAKRGLNDRNIPESTRPPSGERSGIKHHGNKSGFFSILKKSGLAMTLGAWGVFWICAKSHLFPKDWMVPALFLLIVPLMVTGAVLELLRINKKELRRKRLAKAFGMDKENGKRI